MYMNYVINYRIKKEKLNPKNIFILTTDADIDFTPQSVDVLLDIISSHAQVGAVSACTHPKGFGLIYWYQISGGSRGRSTWCKGTPLWTGSSTKKY